MTPAGEILAKLMEDTPEATKSLVSRLPDGWEEAERKREEEERRAEEEQRRVATLTHFGRSEMPAPVRVVDTVSGVLVETKAVERVREWVEKRKTDPHLWCLVLSADKGAGKTTAAGLWLRDLWLWMCRAYEETWKPRYYNGAPDKPEPAWVSISKFARLGAYDGEFDKVCSHEGPLVLDDVGLEYLDTKGWLLQAIDAFVDARYSQCRPTLFTTNLSAAQFKERYSGRVVDRMREGGQFFEFRAESMRGKVSA